MQKMLLPTEKTSPNLSVHKTRTLLYAREKFGKSTLASEFPGAVFFDTENGLTQLSVFRVGITKWEDFAFACAEIASGEHNFETIVIDTIDVLYARCREYVLARHGIEHESDSEWGRGWDYVSTEFARVISKLATMPYGLLLISHATTIEVKTRTGKIPRTVPTIPKRAGNIVIPLMDLCLFGDIAETPQGEETRVLRTKPSQGYEAGDRTGRLPDTIPFSYSALAEAFAKAAADGSLADATPNATAKALAASADLLDDIAHIGHTAPTPAAGSETSTTSTAGNGDTKKRRTS